MGKRKIEIKKIDDKQKRIVTFSKRRQGLFKKAEDVCRLSSAQIAVIVFSPAGKPYSFGNPSVDAVIDQFLLTGTTGDDDHERIMAGGEGDSFWWDNIDMEELDSIEKLQAVKNGLMGLKQNVSNKIQELTSSSSSSSTEAGTTTDNNYLEVKAEDSCMFLREGDGFCWPSDDELAKIMNEDHHDDDGMLLPPLTDHQEIDFFLQPFSMEDYEDKVNLIRGSKYV